MDSHQRRIFVREMRRQGIPDGLKVLVPEKQKSIQTPEFSVALAIVLASISLAAAVVLTVLGVRMKHLSWLLFAAWALVVPACIAFCWFYRRVLTYLLSFALLLCAAFFLAWLDKATDHKDLGKQTVKLQWDNPAPIMSGVKLSKNQLNAKATASGGEVLGTYIYNPTEGTTLPPGTDTLSVSFTPYNWEDFSPVTLTVPIEVDAKGPAEVRSAGIAQMNLRERTALLSKQILEFDKVRNSERSKRQARLIAQSMEDANRPGVNPKAIQSDLNQLPQVLQQYDEETQARFLTYFWPQVLSLERELASAGADVSLISSAVATQGPRSLGLRLNAISDRIGESSQRERTLNSLEREVLSHSTRGYKYQIFAYENDKDSIHFAKVLHDAMSVRNKNVGEVIPFDPKYGHLLAGVRITYPYYDVAGMDLLAPFFLDCGIDSQALVVAPKTRLPLLSNGQPDIMVRIEVWPDLTPQI